MRGKVGKRSSQALSIKAPSPSRGRKTPPCSKGIETFLRFVVVAQLRRKTPPCSKGIETLRRSAKDIVYKVERPRPVLKGLKRHMASLYC